MKLDLKKIISEVMMVEPETINLDSSYNSIAVWDSLTQVEVIFKIQDTAKMKFTPDELALMTNVRSIVNTLKTKGVECIGF